MSEASDRAATIETIRKLSDAIRDVKNAAADRDDVVVELREAQRTRLELLAQELKSVFAEIPPEDDRFDLVISQGLVPRLWIDAVAHVSMGKDRRTYRFLRDTRNGRVVLAESLDMKPVADQVTRYIAERIVERQRDMEGPALSVRPDGIVQAAAGVRSQAGALVPANTESPFAAADPDAPEPGGWRELLRNVAIVLGGALVALIALAIWQRDRLSDLGF